MLVCLKPMCYGVSALEAACMQNRGLAQNVAMSFGEPEKNRSEEVRNYNPTPFTSKQQHHPTISYQLISTTSSTSSCLVLQPMFWALKNHIWCIKLYKFTSSTGQPGQLVTAPMAFFFWGRWRLSAVVAVFARFGRRPERRCIMKLSSFHQPELLGHLGMISLTNHDSSEGEQWGRYNLPRSISCNRN